MADAPNDRAKSGPARAAEADPRIFVVVNGQRFPRPSLETFFAEAVPSEAPEKQGGCTCHAVAGTVVVCRRVCTCVGHSTGGSQVARGGCSCASQVGPVSPGGGCSCVSVSSGGCGCVGHTSRPSGCGCIGYSSGGGGGGCRCAPVH